MNLLGRAMKPLMIRAFGKKGAAFGQLLADWPSIAGSDMAARAIPKDMRFGRDGLNAALVLACASADAPELQMQIPLLLERIKRHFGYALIERIVLEHG